MPDQQQPIDYDALAKKHNAIAPDVSSGIDYDALARKHNAIATHQLIQYNTDQSPTLPDDLPERIGNGVVDALPAVGATAATLFSGGADLPFLAAAGISGLGGAIGSLAKQGVQKVAGSSEAPQSLSDAAKETATDGLLNAGGEAIGRGTNAALMKIFGRYFNPEQLYQSALQPPPGQGAAEVKKAVNFGINNGINLKDGQKALQKTIDLGKEFNRQIDATIMANPNAGTIDPQTVTAPLNQLRANVLKGSGDPLDTAAINAVDQNFNNAHPNLMSPMEAQEAKQALYGEIRRMTPNAYNTATPTPNSLSVDSRAAIADGLMKDLQVLYPSIKDLNAKSGGAIALQTALDRYVAREGNKKIIPWFSTIMASGIVGASGAEFGHPYIGGTAALGFLAGNFLRSALEDPGVKSALAISLRKMGNTTTGKVAQKVGPYFLPGTIKLAANELWPAPNNTPPPQ